MIMEMMIVLVLIMTMVNRMVKVMGMIVRKRLWR